MTRPARGSDAPGAPARLRWWRELVYIGAFYLLYSAVRNLFGSEGGSVAHARDVAFGHAEVVIAIERAVGLFFEERLQRWTLSLPGHGGIVAWNVWYGTAHFVVTAGALLLLFLRAPGRYRLWRTTLAATTAIALVGYASFSLMPPRLLGDCGAFGACADYGFVDTLAEHGALWSFDSGALKAVSNQYAAMPSMHMGWSLWCALVLFPMVRRRWARALVVAYPVVTLVCIVVTGNHYWLDAAAGAACLAVGFWAATRVTAWWEGRPAPASARRRADDTVR
ncbi:MAG TPA: phosphatase PAP2 family protein [Acidimicrobiales bacterium]